MFFRLSLLLFISQISLFKCKTLPNYIAPCSRSSSELNKCIKDHATAALPFIFKGDKSNKLPSLVQYRIAKVEIQASNNLNIQFTDATITGLDAIEIVDASLDLEKRTMKVKGRTPRATLYGNYVMDGRILILPITGKGMGNITLDDVDCDYTLIYDLVKGDNGKDRLKVRTSTLTLDPKVTHYHFENLFNGDKTLGDEMHRFLNENHLEVGKELNPGYAKIVEAVVNKIVYTLIDNTVFDNIVSP